MKKMAYVLLAEGFEEIEALAPIDILRRAKIDVKILAIGDSEMVKSSLGIMVKADGLLKNHLDIAPHLIVTPGGGLGSQNLKQSKMVTDLLKKQSDSDRLVASICASPIALDKAGVLEGKKFTCYPGVEKQISSGSFSDCNIVVDGHLITAKGPGIALNFGLKIVEILIGKAIADEIREAMLIKE